LIDAPTHRTTPFKLQIRRDWTDQTPSNDFASRDEKSITTFGSIQTLECASWFAKRRHFGLAQPLAGCRLGLTIHGCFATGPERPLPAIDWIQRFWQHLRHRAAKAQNATIKLHHDRSGVNAITQFSQKGSQTITRRKGTGGGNPTQENGGLAYCHTAVQCSKISDRYNRRARYYHRAITAKVRQAKLCHQRQQCVSTTSEE
jgi:hypothetical protein